MLVASDICVDSTSSVGTAFTIDLDDSIIAISVEHVSGEASHASEAVGTNFGSGYSEKWLHLFVSDVSSEGGINTFNDDGTVLTYSGLNIYDARAETYKLIFPDIAYYDNHGIACYNVYATLGI